MTRPINVYLDYGRSFFPDDVNRLVSMSGQPKTFRWAYKASHLGDNVYSLGVCKRMFRDDCKELLTNAFAQHGQTIKIVPSVEGIR